MRRLKDQYRGQKGIVILGGPSLVARDYDFSRLEHYQENGFVTFLESKALTPRLLHSGFIPDYLLVPFPETIKGNALHFFIFRSFLAQKNTKWLFKPEYQEIYAHMEENFDSYFEFYRPEKAPNKRYIWKKDVLLENSTFDLIQRHPELKIITNRTGVANHFTNTPSRNQIFYFSTDPENHAKGIEEYFNPIELDDELVLRGNLFLNSSAIAVYPLLNYMGIREVYFLGMDMSMLGTMEYGAPFVFESMRHFYWYFLQTRKTFNADFKMNWPLWRRPESEFDDVKKIFRYPAIRYARIDDQYEFFSKIDGIDHISFQDFDRLATKALK